MNKYLYIITLLFLSNFIFAQDDMQFEYDKPDESAKNTYQAFYFNLHLDIVGGINNTLRNNNYPQMDDFGYQYGIRFGSSRGKKLGAVVDFGYYTRGTLRASVANNTARFNGWSAGIGAEYSLLQTKSLFFRPMVLISYSRYTLNFVENPSGSNIDELINSQYKEFSFRSIQFPVQAGINLGGSFKVKESKLGIMLGVGYILNYDNDNWLIGQATTVSDKINLSSPYASLALFSAID